MSLNCKKCSSTDRVKNGFIRDYQRYKCKQCGCIYTETKPRGKPAAMKALAVLMSFVNAFCIVKCYESWTAHSSFADLSLYFAPRLAV